MNSKLFVWETIHQIQYFLDLSDDEIASLAGVSKGRFKRLKAKGGLLNAYEFIKLASALNLDSQDLYNREFDFDVLKKHFLYQDSLAIKENYAKKAFSNMFTLNNIFEHFAKSDPLGKAEHALRKCQIKKEALNEGRPISIKAINDFMQVMEKYASKGDLREIGRKNAFQLYNGAFGQTLSASRNVKELFEKWLSVEELVERNWNFELTFLNGESLIAHCNPSDGLQDSFDGNVEVRDSIFEIMAGFGDALPLYVGDTPAKTTYMKSEKGEIQFHINFQNSKMPSRPLYLH